VRRMYTIPPVPCRHCKGTGMVPLPTHLFRVLLEVRALKAVFAADVVAELRTLETVKLTAMANRLVALEEFGFLVSERLGRRKRYRLRKPSDPDGNPVGNQERP
jgi:hypothetical protein